MWEPINDLAETNNVDLKHAYVAVMQLSAMLKEKMADIGTIISSVEGIQSVADSPGELVNEVASRMHRDGKFVHITCQSDLRTCTLLLVDKKVSGFDGEEDVLICGIPRDDGSNPFAAVSTSETKIVIDP